MKNIYSVLILAMFFIFSSCNKDDNGVQPTENEPTFTDNIKAMQEKGDNLLSTLLAVKDTASALDSVLKVFLKDTTVLTGEVNSQGIAIKYKNGIIGGIFIVPEDGEPLRKSTFEKTSLNPADPDSYSPTNKKTIFVNPHYAERQPQANSIINLYNAIFPRIGYNPPITLLGEAATVDAMLNLSGYGIVHIYSHGWAYPSKWNITEVYLLTGEEVNAATNEKYKEELYNGNIPLIQIHQDDMRYFISPYLFSNHNNFANDSTIVYGGFCYGFLGSWPNAMIDISKAGAYTGFTWRVETNWNASQARSLFDTLSNNSLKMPRSLDYWFTQTPTIAKQRWDNEDKLFCRMQYTGHSDLILWSSVEISISQNPTSAKPNENIKFTAKSKGKLPSQPKYKWNFGDGSAEQIIINDSTVTHSFANEGTFQVTVELLDQSNKKIATATLQTVITAAIVTPNFISATVEINPGYGVNNWTCQGKYYTLDAYGWPTKILRDTTYSGTDTTGASASYFGKITMSGNSFSGSILRTDSTGGVLSVSNSSISGSYDPATKSVSVTISYSSTGTILYNTYNVKVDWSCSATSVPVYSQSPSSYYFKTEGLIACDYISSYTRSYIMDPIPPLGVTDSGIKKSENSSTYWCHEGSRVTISLSIY
ncbi:MAG: PKD domain-containing protein [Ignavibacteriales bacterium]|nr:MAG: PKD domain-containing protein [Ignavibacteriales bacterium]